MQKNKSKEPAQQNPTLKQLFSKTNLTSYVEAARHKPLTDF
jgi:hypothetical protein